MRNLKKLLDDALKVTGGQMPMDLLAVDEAEATALRDLLRGRHGAKSITIRVAEPGEMQPNLHWR